jgi:hypothetical protein
MCAMNARLLRPLASGFDPRRIAGLQAWYDFADASTLGPTSSGVGAVSNNGPVRFVKDKSAAANNLNNIHADPSVPSFLSSSQNGKSAVSFDGGDILNASVSLMTTPFSLFIVCKANATGTARVCGVGANRSIGPFASSNTQWGFFNAGGIASFGVSATAASVLALTANASLAGVFFGNNTQNTTATLATVTPLAFAIGSSEAASFGLFNGIVYEVLSYNAALTTTQVTAVSRYLGKKWGITVA